MTVIHAYSEKHKMINKNIIIVGVGHSGTKFLNSTLRILGWNTGQLNESYEHTELAALNIEAMRTGVLDYKTALALLSIMPQPFVMRDPRFVYTLHMWEPILNNCAIILFERDAEHLVEEHQRRGTPMTIEAVKNAQKEARNQFQRFQGHKIAITHAQLTKIVQDIMDREPQSRAGIIALGE